ncbi:hypothetical protein F4679DRAFT_530036 [Xylaria curta]|nr:hypothetical protein F4679DRAFT_530036 [Xylaria curta]
MVEPTELVAAFIILKGMLLCSLSTSYSHEDTLNERADINEPSSLLSSKQGRTTLGEKVGVDFLLILRQLIVLHRYYYVTNLMLYTPLTAIDSLTYFPKAVSLSVRLTL